MGGYWSLPEVWVDQPELSASWVERARAHVATLPPKAQKRSTKKKTTQR